MRRHLWGTVIMIFFFPFSTAVFIYKHTCIHTREDDTEDYEIFSRLIISNSYCYYSGRFGVYLRSVEQPPGCHVRRTRPLASFQRLFLRLLQASELGLTRSLQQP